MSPGDRQTAGRATERAAPPGVQFDEATGTYRTPFDPDVRPASDAVVSTVAIVDRSDPLDLPPLHSAVDCDALNGLFATPAVRPGRFDGTVAFEYAGHRVTVDGDGVIEVEPAEGHRSRPTG